MAVIKMQSPAQAARERELIKNPKALVPRTEITKGIMRAVVYPTTGAVLIKMDTGQSIALTYEEAVVLRDLLAEHLPTKETEEETKEEQGKRG